MDHVIVTNFEGDIALYRGPELAPLIRDILESEFDLSSFEAEDPDQEEFHLELIEAIRNPTIGTLTAALAAVDTDTFYSGPRE